MSRKAWLRIGALLIGLSGSACDSPSPVGVSEVSPPDIGDAALGELVFLGQCASCHASRDGFDVAFFSFADSTIIRRALAHVDSAAALDVVAYIRSLGIVGAGPDTRVFQPGGRLLRDDFEFARTLFGLDQWPTTMTTEGLLAVDPRSAPVAVPFPLWSSEGDNLDWMPDQGLPVAVLDENHGRARRKLADFRESPSEARFIEAVNAIRVASSGPPSSPCSHEDKPRYAECFDVRRWVASFSGQYVLRHEPKAPLPRGLTEPWWEVGHAAKRIADAPGSGGPPEIPNARENAVTWMYLGWSFDPGRESSAYLGRQLTTLGLPRHATFVVLRSMVARATGDLDPYYDVRVAGRYVIAGWARSAMEFSYKHLLERLTSGDRPSPEYLPLARDLVQTGFDLASERMTPEDASDVRKLLEAVLEDLQ